MGKQRQWRCWWLVAVVLLGATTAQAGARTGWGWRSADFAGTATFYDAGGGVSATYAATGAFDFQAGTVTFSGITDLYFGSSWTVPGGAVTFNSVDTTYTGDLSLDWDVNSYPVTVPWEIVNVVNRTGTLHTLDGNGDGIPGLPVASGFMTDMSLVIDGTLTAPVPEPMSGVLVVGALGVVVVCRRSRPFGPGSRAWPAPTADTQAAEHR